MKQFSYSDETCRGAFRRFEYTGSEGARKYALVYLPFGYDEGDRRYNVLYMMHGGGGSPDAWPDSCPVKNMLDRSFSSGEAEPMIVVFPTFYTRGAVRTPGQVDEGYELKCVLTFQEELVRDLIPAVEGAFRGWADGTDPGSLKKARGHRGFGGFSMGSVNTWFAFSLHLDYFSVFLPLSGDSWELGPLGGGKKPRDTAERLRESALAFGFGPGDFSFYAATGTEDIAYPNLTPQIDAMKELDDVFRFSDDPGSGNLHYLLGEGMDHSYCAVSRYLYNYLPYLFQK